MTRSRCFPGRLALIAGLAIAARLCLALAFPVNGGDWPTYSTVAENILRGCGVSLSLPASGECLPHYGGNHLPGLPFYIALVWRLFDHSDMAIRVVQILIYAAALAWLIVATRRYSGSDAAAALAGLVMALSPAQIGWSRFTLTDALSIAAVSWFFAEVLLSLAGRRLRAIPMALAITCAGWLRWDGFLLVIPAGLTALFIHRLTDAFGKCVIIGVIIAAPIAAWTWRNIATGISPWPPIAMIERTSARSPYGYFAWTATWVSGEYQRVGAIWPLTFMQYRDIDIDPRAYDGAGERARVEALIDELKSFQGRPFPPSIDAGFAEIASERAARSPLRVYVELPLRRAVALWTNPYASFGWPSEIRIDNRDRLSGGPAILLALARDHPVHAAAKLMVTFYRFALSGAFLAVLALYARGCLARPRDLVWITLAWVVARTLFLAITSNLHSHYTLEFFPAVELTVALCVCDWRDRSKRVPPA